MKLLRYIAILPLILFPLFASAQSIPAFPMALWGNVTINGDAAPAGTIVRAYYGSTLAGTVTVQDAGVYGYTAPTAQKLIVGEGTGPITFTVQSSSFNSGAETGGTTVLTYPQFTSASTTEYDLAFTVSVPAPPSSGGGGGGGGGSSGGGGGGGGGVVASNTSSTPAVVTQTPVATTTTVAVAPTVTTQGKVLGAAAYNFTKTLQVGSTGADVTALQNLLLADGFSIPAGATGYFGGQTKTAVIAFQKAHGLAQVGLVGPLTRALLNQGTNPAIPETSTTATTTPVSSSSLTTTQVQAILSLLQAFGADATTISNVEAALNASH